MAGNTNKGQQQTIETLDRAIQVSAGAGAGKTYTLSRRLVHGFDANAKGNDPYLTQSDQVMGITFTKKAAAELAHRVRRMLKQKGMIDVSRTIDEAWIMTIDAMCSRILKAHAIKEGIDPDFEVGDEGQLDELMAEFIENEIDLERTACTADNTPTGKALMIEDMIKGYGYPTLVSAVQGLVYQIVNLAASNDDLQLVTNPQIDPSNPQIREVLSRLVAAAQDVYAQVGDQFYLQKAEELLTFEKEVLGSQAYTAYEKLFLLVGRAVDMVGASRRKAGKGELYEGYDIAVSQAVDALVTCYAQVVLELACNCRDFLDRQARETGVFSYAQIANLVRKILEGQKDVSGRYKDQFKVIMVDEFQDTSQSQIDIIKHLAKDDLSNVCTVGDEQQSIYAFRGADVAIYRQHKKEMAALGALQPQLEVNYRSHDHILRAVDRIFMNPALFGDAMLSLSAGRPEEKDKEFLQDESRIRFLDCAEKSTREERAAALAQEFARLRDKGVAPSKMAVLLEKMAGVGPVYIEALRDQGFDVVVQGGSGFFETGEVKLFVNLVRLLRNTLDDIVLIEMLTSPLFQMDETQLAYLALSQNAPHERRASLWERLQRFSRHEAASQHTKDIAVILMQAHAALTYGSVADALEYVLETTAYDMELLSQGVEGKSRYANILKLFNMIREQEDEGFVGVHQVHEALSKLQNSKEKPAALQADNAVRVMTIHMSKGLEFDVVGVGEIPHQFERGSKSASLFTLVRRDNQLNFGGGKITKSVFEKLFGVAPHTKVIDLLKAVDPHETTPQNFASALLTQASQDQQAERYRKYYVAFTRAKECLVMVSTQANSPESVRSKIVESLIDENRACGADETGATRYLLPQPDKYGSPIVVSYHKKEPAPQEEAHEKEGIIPRFETSAHAHPRSFDPARAQVKPSWTTEFLAHTKDISQLELSYSSLKEDAHSFVSNRLLGDEERLLHARTQGKQLVGETSPEREQAFAFGTAFHEFAETVVLSQTGKLTKEELLAYAQTYFELHNLDPKIHERFMAAVEAWWSSELYPLLTGPARVLPEAPFKLRIALSQDPAASFVFKGSIDALVIDAQNPRHATVIDYKTGYRIPDDEAAAHFVGQAQSYAYACLKDGFTQVDAIFYRIELGRSTRFSYSENDVEFLERQILQMYEEQQDKTDALMHLP